MSDKVILNFGRGYIILVMSIGISFGILDLHLWGWLVWLFGLVVPLLWLLVIRRRIER